MEMIGIHPQAQLWLDVDAEDGKRTEKVSGHCLDDHDANLLSDMADMYRGDLLEGMYQSWCLSERDRLQRIYIAALVKLMDYSEAHHDYATGISYGERILFIDPAHRHPQSLMLAHYLSGDKWRH
jgi:two-component SAPR family response regulator